MLQPARQQPVAGTLLVEARLLGGVQDGVALTSIERSVGPGHLDEGHQRERGERPRIDAHLDELLQHAIVGDPRDLGERPFGVAGLSALAELGQQLLVGLLEELVLERLAAVACGLVGHARNLAWPGRWVCPV